MSESLLLTGEGLDVETLAAAAMGGRTITLDAAGLARMEETRALVARALERGDAVYGLTRGLGPRAGESLDAEAIAGFSRATVLGRAHAIGEALPTSAVRAAMIVRANTLLRGASGARPEIARHLAACLNARLTPIVGAIGSIGASDLLLNATLARALIGEGAMRDAEARERPGAEILATAGIAPPALEPRDGLALIAHSSFSASLAGLAVAEAVQIFEAAQTAAALSMEAFRANPSPLDPAVLAARPQAGQARAAAGLRARLAHGALDAPDAARRLQDPLSFRCLAQIHGAALAATEAARNAAETEMNAASDNPVALIETDRIVSSGGFHTPHLTLALETLTRAWAHIAMAVLGRLSKLLSERFTALPQYLTEHETANGYAPLMKNAEALAAEIVHAANPAPIWPSLCADGVEDSMTSSLLAAKALSTALERARALIAIELMVATQAAELRGGPHAPALRAAMTRVRVHSARLYEERPLGPEIEAVAGEIEAIADAWLEGKA